MRIIAGEYRGYKLESVKSDKTRPTLDRVREALFSSLMNYLDGAKVLDLFSGTGALGLESISRGAKYAVLNDKSQDSFKAILANVNNMKCNEKVQISKKEADKCIAKLGKENEKFDIIFIDPPYLSNLGVKSIENISKYDILEEDGIIVFETDKEVKYPHEIANFEVINVKKYGRVEVSFWKRKG